MSERTSTLARRRAPPRQSGNAGFTVPSGRGRTVPVTRSDVLRPQRVRPVDDALDDPVWSRTSTKARCSPCSRRRATQPQMLTTLPASPARSAPQ